MNGDCALRRGDKVQNVRTHEVGTVITADRLVVTVTGPDGQPAHWAHDEVIWAEGFLGEQAGE